MSTLTSKYLCFLTGIERKRLTLKTMVLCGLVALLLYRCCMLWQPYLLVFFDEAYYYHWSQDPAFGYYSKPPFVAWLISLTTSFLGVSSAALKFASPICYYLAALNVFWITRRVSNERAALYALIVFSCAPLVGFNSLFITTDAPLFLWWSVTLLWALRYEAQPSVVNAVVLGLGLGCGMLSKYTFALLPLGLFIYLCIFQRTLCFRFSLWMAIAIGLAIFSLNVVWNAENGFVAAKHTQEIAQLDGELLDFSSFFAFLGTQFVIFGVVPSIAIFSNRKRWVKAFTQVRYQYLLLLVTVPILVTIALQSLLSRAFANWAGPFMIGASVLAGIALSRMKLRYLLVGTLLNLLLLSLFYHWPLLLNATGYEQNKRNSPYARVAAWPELAEKIAELSPSDVENLPMISNSRELLAYVGFYNQMHVDQLLFWNSNQGDVRNHYDLKNNIQLRADVADSALLLITKPDGAAAVLTTFKDVRFLGRVETEQSEGVLRAADVYEVRGFTGYDHRQYDQ